MSRKAPVRIGNRKVDVRALPQPTMRTPTLREPTLRTTPSEVQVRVRPGGRPVRDVRLRFVQGIRLVRTMHHKNAQSSVQASKHAA